MKESDENQKGRLNFLELWKENDNSIPKEIKLCVDFLEKEGQETKGIFRLSSASTEVDKLMNNFAEGKISTQQDLQEYNVLVVANFLKSFLRSLSSPILPKTFNSACKSVNKSDEKEAVRQINKIMSQLPSANRITLHYILKFLSELTKKSEMNLMTPQNLAIVFAPCIIKSSFEGDQVEASLAEMDLSTAVCGLIEIILTHFEQVFEGVSLVYQAKNEKSRELAIDSWMNGETK